MGKCVMRSREASIDTIQKLSAEERMRQPEPEEWLRLHDPLLQKRAARSGACNDGNEPAATPDESAGPHPPPAQDEGGGP
ncbi:hypothetical protein VARIO8X_100094 [Burkholderiales bacterium 8X]|nr:hypothetical protein VARIO8X_100094 [Burkholderiales bacterium 8X]